MDKRLRAPLSSGSDVRRGERKPEKANLSDKG